MTCGIYILYFETNDGMFYVGQSDNIEGRLVDHKSYLRLGKHHSWKMQEYYEKYKVFPVQRLLEETIPELLNKREEYWIAEFDCYNIGFNGTTGGDSVRGEHHPRATISEEIAVQVMLLSANTALSMRAISKQLSISYHVVVDICRGKSWNILGISHPIEYTRMVEKLHTRPMGGNTSRIALYPNLLSPDGKVYDVINATAFAREHGLDQAAITRVLNSKAKSHLGWTLAK